MEAKDLSYVRCNPITYIAPEEKAAVCGMSIECVCDLLKCPGSPTKTLSAAAPPLFALSSLLLDPGKLSQFGYRSYFRPARNGNENKKNSYQAAWT